MNEIRLLTGRKNGVGQLSKQAVACVAIVLVLALPRLMAGTDMKEITPTLATADEKDWTLELGSGVGWSNVRSGEPNKPYTIVPIDFTASLAVDEVSLDNFLGGWLRGNTEFFFRGDYNQIVRGPGEHHLEGIMVGPRYNFVQPGWKVIPFWEGGVGIAFADSNSNAGGLGQDFNFTFEAAAGAKFLITDDWFARLEVEYQHYSNGGLSDPTPNHPIDELGPRLSFGCAF